MPHRSLQGAPTESSENLTFGQISLRVRKDNVLNTFFSKSLFTKINKSNQFFFHPLPKIAKNGIRFIY